MVIVDMHAYVMSERCADELHTAGDPRTHA
jgi:hypothetical protein